MQKSQFKFNYDIAILMRFKMPTKWWQMTKIHTFNLPTLEEDDFSAKIGTVDATNYFEVVTIKADFLETTRGRSFFNAYLAELRCLSTPQREYLKKNSLEMLGYSFNLTIENTQSHALPIYLNTFEVVTVTKQLLHTARGLKNAQLSGKKLVLNDDNNDNFDQEYLSIADYLQIENDLVELHYSDLDAETDEEFNKVHIAFFDAKTFVSQFNNAAHDISDLISKICHALQISTQDLEKST